MMRPRLAARSPPARHAPAALALLTLLALAQPPPALGGKRDALPAPQPVGAVPPAVAPKLGVTPPNAPSLRRPTEVSTSVIITSFWDMEGQIASPSGQGSVTPCAYVVQRSAAFGAKRINLVTTINALGSDSKLGKYAYKDVSGALLDATPDLAARYEAGVTRCVRAALDAGFTTIHILPHVDVEQPKEKGGRGLWRNIVKFDPLAKIGSPPMSYEDTLLQPVARAINSAVPASVVVEFAVAGEQGRSVWSFPRAWIKALDNTRATSAKGKGAAARHLMGVSFNWDKVCGCVEPEDPDPIRYNTTYPDRFRRFVAKGGLKTIDVPGVVALMERSDFLGASGYAPMWQVPSFTEMERTWQTMAYELAFFNISLKDSMFKQNKPWVYSEQGLGGTDRGGRVAPNVTFVAGHPWLGYWPVEGWTKQRDPWQVAAFSDYRRRLYGVIADWAAKGGGPQYRVDGMFMWSVGTWDVLGVHPQSSGNGGTFADPRVQATLTALNKKVNDPAARRGGKQKRP